MIKGELLPDGVRPRPRPIRARADQIDTLSRWIIELLQVDGRRTPASIADELGLEQSFVEARLEELAASRRIRVVAVCDAARLGFNRQAMLGVSTEPAVAEGVAAKLADLTEVVYLMLSTGPYDVLAEVFATSDDHLGQVVAQVRSTPGVTHVGIYPYVAVRKQTYAWSAR